MTLHELLSKPAAEWTQADIDACMQAKEKELTEMLGTDTEYARGLIHGHLTGRRFILETLQMKAQLKP